MNKPIALGAGLLVMLLTGASLHAHDTNRQRATEQNTKVSALQSDLSTQTTLIAAQKATIDNQQNTLDALQKEVQSLR